MRPASSYEVTLPRSSWAVAGDALEQPTGHFQGTCCGPANGWVRPIRDAARNHP